MPATLTGQTATDIYAEAIQRYAQHLLQQQWGRVGLPAPRHQRSPEDQALYDTCRWDLGLFALTFFPHWCTEDFNEVHLDYYHLHHTRQGKRGMRDVVAAPRGSSKTTGCALLGILHDCCYQTELFIVYLTNTYDNAENKVASLRDELEFNAALVRVYGQQVGPVWNKGDFTTTGSTRVLAAARYSQVRGITKGGARPTKIVLDDIEHPEQVLTEFQRKKTAQWFLSDIMKMGQPMTNVEFSGTILHPESLLAQTLENPGWHARFYQAVRHFSDEASVSLWEQWRQIFIDKTNPNHQEDARAFYEQHEAEMTHGAEVLWPQRFDYYALMVQRLVDGEEAFWTELQNNPRQDARYIFHMDDASYFSITNDALVLENGRIVHFLDMVGLAAYWDPTPDRQSHDGDYTCFVVGMKDKWGYLYVVDAYCAQEPSVDVATDAIIDLIWHWQIGQIGIERNGFQSLLPNELRRKMVARARRKKQPFQTTFVPLLNQRNKILRIKTLEPLITNGWMAFSDSLPPAVYEQFRDFIPIEKMSKHDDAPDAIEGMARVLNGLYDRRAAF